MDFHELVRRRRMVRNYEREFAVPREKIERIVETARRAPSAGFAQGQSFVIVTDRAARSAIAETLKEPSFRTRGFDPWISHAPVHIVICTSEAIYRRRYGEADKAGTSGAKGAWRVPWWYWDAGASFMLLLLGAASEDLGAGFLAFDGSEDRQRIRDLLGIPSEVEPVGVVTVGKPARDRRSASLRRGWKPKEDVIHWDRWREG